MAAALNTCTRGEVATLVRRILSVSPGDGLQAWFAVTQWFKPRSVVEQAASMARLISPKRTKNVNELQVAVMQWELTLVEHESKFSDDKIGSCATCRPSLLSSANLVALICVFNVLSDFGQLAEVELSEVDLAEVEHPPNLAFEKLA